VHVPGAADPVPAKVSMVSPALDPGSTTVEVWLKIDNKSGKLKVGVPAKVSITGKTVAQAWKVPDGAIVTADDGSKSVMVVGSDGEAHRKPVTLGIDDGTNVQIVSGLAATDFVITGGAYALDEGTKVKIGLAAGDKDTGSGGND
jgi:multidrug efflux pump subunit AcrA (membrane-fusion protein)